MEQDTTATNGGRVYELGYVFFGTIAETEIPAKVGALKEKIEAKGGQFISEEFPKLIPLAYEMSKIVDNKKVWCHEGYFGWMKFEIDPKEADMLSTELSGDNSIVRFLV